MAKLRAVRDYYTNPQNYLSGDTHFRARTGELISRVKPIHEALGLDWMGEGHFSQAFALGKKWVVKITTNRDPGYEAYAKWAMENQSNPWVPRIRAMAEIPSANVMVYVIERLSPCRDVDIAQIIYGYLNTPEKAHCPHLHDLLVGFGTLNFNDVSTRNIMRRENGQLVLTDPCCSFHGLGAMRRVERGPRDWDRLIGGGSLHFPRLRMEFMPMLVDNRHGDFFQFQPKPTEPAKPQAERDRCRIPPNLREGHRNFIMGRKPR